MTVTYTKVYEDSTSFPSNAAATYDVSNPLPAGLIEAIGVKWSGTTAAANIATGCQGNLVSALRMTLNGDQWLNFNPTKAAADDTAQVSRMGAFVQDLGGSIATEGSLTSQDTTIWIPCGISVPQNSRFELHIGYIAGVVAMASGGRFSLWIKYGKSSSATIVGNMTSQSVAVNTQTMISVKIPTYRNATVTGIALQCPTQEDLLTSIICKPLGDFALTGTQLRSASGANTNGYMFQNNTVNTRAQQVCNLTLGYYFIPLYALKSTDGNVVLLLETIAGAGAETTQNWTATPVLALPTGGSGEKQAVQTASKASGAAQTILSRAESSQ